MSLVYVVVEEELVRLDDAKIILDAESDREKRQQFQREMMQSQIYRPIYLISIEI